MKKYLIEIVLSCIYLRRVEVADNYGPLQEDALVPVRFQRRGHLSAFPGIEADNAAPSKYEAPGNELKTLLKTFTSSSETLPITLNPS